MPQRTEQDKQTEQKLWSAYHADRSDANRNKLVELYLGYVRSVAINMHTKLPAYSMVMVDDLVTYGVLGLMDAIKKYDPKTRAKFLTYSSLRISGAMKDGLRELDRVKRRSRQDYPKTFSLSYTGRYKSQHGDWSEAFSPIVETFSTCDPTPSFENTELIRNLMVGLNKRERLILISYYSLGCSLLETGKSLGLSESRVSQLMTDIKQRVHERWPNGLNGFDYEETAA